MKKNSLLIILSFISISLFSQNEIQTKKSHYKSGNIKSEINFYKKNSKKIREGKSSWWYETGELKNTQLFKKGKLNGERISYWQDGKIKRKDVFKKGKLKSGKCFDENGQEIEYYNFEIQPEFPGGKVAFNKFIKTELMSYEVKGRLVFKFNIEANGKVSNLRILKDTYPSLKKEVSNMFDSMPNWKPAKQDGNSVKVSRTIPVNFE
jgi:hypothetical protein